MTVVTQFITADGTATGKLSEIRRIYVQGGKVIQNSKTQIPGMAEFNLITPDFCRAQKTVFADTDSFTSKGGFGGVSKAFDNEMVLVMLIWDDHAANMLWLNSNYPTTADASQTGVAHGSICKPGRSSRKAPGVEPQEPSTLWGELLPRLPS